MKKTKIDLRYRPTRLQKNSQSSSSSSLPLSLYFFLLIKYRASSTIPVARPHQAQWVFPQSMATVSTVVLASSALFKRCRGLVAFRDVETGCMPYPMAMWVTQDIPSKWCDLNKHPKMVEKASSADSTKTMADVLGEYKSEYEMDQVGVDVGATV